jgi:RIO kinase 1
VADHGPEPTPAWVITSGDARQVDLGLLKTGKEAHVHLVERRHGDAVNVLAAKRYREFEERLFRNHVRSIEVGAVQSRFGPRLTRRTTV